MTNSEVKQILAAKGGDRLYHANSVATAVTFLENGGLISRGVVRDSDLFQTDQQTDDKDEQVGVFYDIFLDSVDIHQRAHRCNDYGPVTFEFSLDLLDELPENSIKITKDNPIRWTNEMTEEERYFTDPYELQRDYFKGDFNKHLTIVQQYDPLPFTYLTKIILDNPYAADADDDKIYHSAKEYLQHLMRKHSIDVPLIIRDCPEYCKCRNQYNESQKGYIWHKFGYRE